MNNEEPVYEDIDDTGTPVNQQKMDRKAREPKTRFEHALIATHPSRKRFESKPQHDRVKRIEEKLRTGTPAAKIYRVFCAKKIQWGKEKNIPLNSILTAMENQEALISFTQQYGDEILKKKSAQEIQEELSSRGIKRVGDLYNDD